MKSIFIHAIVGILFYAILLSLVFLALLPSFTASILNAWGFVISPSVLRTTWAGIGAIYVTLRLTNKIL